MIKNAKKKKTPNITLIQNEEEVLKKTDTKVKKTIQSKQKLISIPN